MCVSFSFGFWSRIHPCHITDRVPNMFTCSVLQFDWFIYLYPHVSLCLIVKSCFVQMCRFEPYILLFFISVFPNSASYHFYVSAFQAMNFDNDFWDTLNKVHICPCIVPKIATSHYYYINSLFLLILYSSIYFFINTVICTIWEMKGVYSHL